MPCGGRGLGMVCKGASSTRVLLLDDYTIWQPPVVLQTLWTYLRLLLLESVLVVRCASKGRACSSSGVISRFKADCSSS